MKNLFQSTAATASFESGWSFIPVISTLRYKPSIYKPIHVAISPYLWQFTETWPDGVYLQPRKV